MFEANKEYEVKIDGVAFIESATKHTPGLEFRLVHETAGVMIHTLWIVPKTRERAWETLRGFGIATSDLKSAEFWDNPESFFDGKSATITTKTETYVNRAGETKSKVAVEWFNPIGGARRAKKANHEVAVGVAELFSAFEDDPDQDVPF